MKTLQRYAGEEYSSGIEANESMPTLSPPETELGNKEFSAQENQVALNWSPTQSALMEVEIFRRSSDAGAWSNIPKNEFIISLVDRINNPRALNQMSLNACGPASFLLTLAMDDIVKFTKLAINLYRGGVTELNGMQFQFDPNNALDHYDGQIRPHDGLRDRRPGDSQWNSPSVNTIVDYILMASFRSDDTFGADIGEVVTGGAVTQFEDPGDTWQGATFPASLQNWFEESGSYQDVVDNTRLIPRNAEHMEGVLHEEYHKNQYRCHMLINAHMITVGVGDQPNLRDAKADHEKPAEWGNYIQESVANHWIVYQGNLTRSGGNIAFDIWSWGRDMRIELPESQFNQMYFGAVCAKPYGV